MKFVAFAGLAVALLLAGCSSGNRSASSSAAATAAPRNAIDFPLFDGASILSSHSWQQRVGPHPAVGDDALFDRGGGTYAGHDVVAGTQALLPGLEDWLAGLRAHPPGGYTSVAQSDTAEAVRGRMRDLGVDFGVFERTELGKRHGVVVLTVDPETLDAKAGPMLGVVAKVKYLPHSLRDSLDVQVKKETGFTLSEAANPDSPLGAAVSALAELRDFGGRGIVLIDAVKQ